MRTPNASAFVRLAAAALMLAVASHAAEIGDKDFTADDLFRWTRVWNVELTFTSEEWSKIEPRNTGKRGPSALLAAPGMKNGLAGAGGLVFDWVHADLRIASGANSGTVFRNIGVRYKGNGTYYQGRQAGKVSFKLDLDKFVKGQKLAKMEKLSLANNITDATWTNETIGYRLFRDANLPAPRTTYARVYATVTGTRPRTYLGLYSLTEDVDSVFLDRWFHSGLSQSKDGALYKPTMTNPFVYLGDDWAAYDQQYGPKQTPTAEQQQRIFDFARLVTSGSDAEFAEHAGDFIDIEEFARFMAVTVWSVNTDSILDHGQNYLFYQNPNTKRFSFIAWDQDLSFAHSGMQDSRSDLSISHPWLGTNRFLERMFSLEAFRRLYLADLVAYGNTIFRPERLAAQVDELAAAIGPALQDEPKDRPVHLDDAVAARSYSWPRGTNVPIKAFVRVRAQNVLEQLRELDTTK